MPQTKHPITIQEEMLQCPFCAGVKISSVRAEISRYGDFNAHLNCDTCKQSFFLEFDQYSEYREDSASTLTMNSYTSEPVVCSKCGEESDNE